MIAKFFFLVFIFLASCALTVVSFVVLLIKQGGIKENKPWFITMMTALFVAIGSFTYTLYKTVSTTKNLFDSVTTNGSWSTSTYHYSTNESDFINKLKALSDSNDQLYINPNFYTYFGENSWKRFPLMYPYSVNKNLSTDSIYLATESDVIDIAFSQNNVSILSKGQLEQFTFNSDKIFFICRKENNQLLYFVLDTETEQVVQFDTKEKWSEEMKTELITEKLYTFDSYSLEF